jgi:serine/threonine-protein kinase PRP4
MFTGRSNNEMLRLMMACKGRPPNKLIRAHIRAYEVLGLDAFFEQDLRFRQWDVDALSGKPCVRLVEVSVAASGDIQVALLGAKAGADDRKQVLHLSDLLDKILSLESAKRITIVDALKHPLFITQK